MKITRCAAVLAAGLLAFPPFNGQALATDCLTAACAAADPRARDDRPPRVRDHRPPRLRDHRTPRVQDDKTTRVPATRGRIRYTLWNDTQQAVSFRLPTGQTYRLEPGERRQFTNAGADKPRIYVHNSGREYTLKSGEHRFWWMPKQTRIGLDLDDR